MKLGCWQCCYSGDIWITPPPPPPFEFARRVSCKLQYVHKVTNHGKNWKKLNKFKKKSSEGTKWLQHLRHLLCEDDVLPKFSEIVWDRLTQTTASDFFAGISITLYKTWFLATCRLDCIFAYFHILTKNSHRRKFFLALGRVGPGMLWMGALILLITPDSLHALFAEWAVKYVECSE